MELLIIGLMLAILWRINRRRPQDDPEPETWTLRGTLTIADDDTDE